MRQFNRKNAASVFYFLACVAPQTAPLGFRLKLCVSSMLGGESGPCSQQLGHLKVTLPVQAFPVVFQGWPGGQDYANQPLLCSAGFIYTLVCYFLFLWLLPSLLGLSEAASVSYIFYFDFPWLVWGFAETKNKRKQNAPTPWNTGAAEAGERKWMSTMKILDSGIAGCSDHQLMSWEYLCSSAILNPWLLPNYQTKWLFFFA